MSKKYIILLFIIFSTRSFAQSNLNGRVVEQIEAKEMSIPGVNVYTTDGMGVAYTDSAGKFSFEVAMNFPIELVFSFPGYKKDTVKFENASFRKIMLKKSIDLKEVEVSARQSSVIVSTINPMNAEKITQRELLKAACCNLSEAFETNPSVNVAFKDAVTGVKEIQLLGLGGTYVQMLSENIPDMRGLAGIYGLTFVPGPWIESIQLTKGSGSVVNGYESTTGQINLEYKKPLEKEQPRFFLNLFSDERGGMEANAILKKKIASKLSSMLMIHGRYMKKETDRNSDGFMDVPDNKTINIFNRWQYHDNERMEGQLSLKFVADRIEGGQTDIQRSYNRYQTLVTTTRAEVSGKVGFIYPTKPMKSIGNIYQVTYHDMRSAFGLKNYNAKESSVYLQSIYQNILWKSNHQYKAGITYRYNLLQEHVAGMPGRVEENIPGVFLEYTYNYLDKLTLIAGMREDLQHGNDWVFTPRLHGKYNFTQDLIVRFSAGESYRRPYIIADHLSVLASSREIVIKEVIRAERSWNYGMNITKRFDIPGHELTLSGDFYRTEFQNQLIEDAYSDSTKILFYNLDGVSYSNSMQLTMNVELVEMLSLRLAYKTDDVRSTYLGKTEEQPLTAKERAMGTISYTTPGEHWKFDYTVAWEGKKRLQNIHGDGGSNGNEFSPSFSVMNFQVTKIFRRVELYAGGENILDYRQMNPIIHPENPFGNSFDATNIWGPIEGRRIYAGVRWTVK